MLKDDSIKFYSNNVRRQKLWQENVPKTRVEQIKGSGRSYPYLYPIGDLTQGSFHKGFHVCIDQGLPTNSELKVNKELTMMQVMMQMTGDDGVHESQSKRTWGMGDFYFVINITYQKNERLYVATNAYIVLKEVLHGVTTQKKKTYTIGYNF